MTLATLAECLNEPHRKKALMDPESVRSPCNTVPAIGSTEFHFLLLFSCARETDTVLNVHIPNGSAHPSLPTPFSFYNLTTATGPITITSTSTTIILLP